MKLLEIYFWNALYWAMYLPLSLILHIVTEQGDILGILLIGAIMTAILTIYLAFSDGVLFDDMEPAIIVYEDKSKSKVQPAPKPAPVKDEIKPTEVKKDEKQKTEQIDLEPAPKMDTDVDLGQPDDSNNDILG